MDANEIIAEVAKRNRVVLAPTDPVMVVATIAELQMEAGRKALAKVVKEALDQASAGTEQQIEAARKIGEAIITGAAAWSADQIRKAGDQAAERMQAQVAALDHRAIRAERTAICAASIGVGAVMLMVAGIAGYLLV
ncbi:MAG TPA: hypothetical protein VHT74_00890 [Acetobacteraceae bacterium]|jgi:hypothetical protein|nr:hypothetical protein [Acetobacteraceae bacterium]